MSGARRLDGYQLILLRRPADSPAFDDAALDRLQQEHLAFYDAQLPPGTRVAPGIPVELPE